MMMIQKSLTMFNMFHGLRAEVEKVDGGYILKLDGAMTGFDTVENLSHFLLCGTTHLKAVKRVKSYFSAYNLAVIHLNKLVKDGVKVVYSEDRNGRATVWGLYRGKWFKVVEYSSLFALYSSILLKDGAEVREEIERQTTFFKTLKRMVGF